MNKAKDTVATVSSGLFQSTLNPECTWLLPEDGDELCSLPNRGMLGCIGFRALNYPDRQ